jgi:hypothetical protein
MNPGTCDQIVFGHHTDIYRLSSAFICVHLRLSAVTNPKVFNLYRFHFGIG